MNSKMDEVVKNWFDGDFFLFVQAVELLANDKDKWLTNLEGALQSGVAHDIAFLIHKIRGSLSNLGEERVSKLLAELEEASRAGQSPRVDIAWIRAELNSWLKSVNEYIAHRVATKFSA